jgi:hypothetical protein
MASILKAYWLAEQATNNGISKKVSCASSIQAATHRSPTTCAAHRVFERKWKQRCIRGAYVKGVSAVPDISSTFFPLATPFYPNYSCLFYPWPFHDRFYTPRATSFPTPSHRYPRSSSLSRLPLTTPILRPTRYSHPLRLSRLLLLPLNPLILSPRLCLSLLHEAVPSLSSTTSNPHFQSCPFSYTARPPAPSPIST